MDVYQAALGRRTIRKFKQRPIEHGILEKLVNAARLAPSANNLQPLKYMIVDDPEKVAGVFRHVRWAGYIAPAGNPQKGEEPVAFILLLADTTIRKSDYELDVGAAAQSIFLTAFEEGIGTCWMGAIDRDAIRKTLSVPEEYAINTVVALGYPAESPVVEEEEGSIKYYKDGEGVLHVPKRRLRDILL